MVLLSALARSLPCPYELRGEAEISGLRADSRTVLPGDLFFCISGFHRDGHVFAAQALAAGAVALCAERDTGLALPCLFVKNVREAVGYLAGAFYDNPSQSLQLAGVTGTNGKTTVTHIMEAMLRADGRNAGLIGTLGTRFAGTTLPSALTTPEALELQGLLAAMVKEGVTDVAMEASSQALDLGRLNACSFSSAIFTNLSQDHLDFHGTMDAYLAAKTKLFSELVRGNRAPILINIDGEAGLTLSSSLSSRPVTYGLKAGADYVAEAVQLAATGVNFRIRHGSQSDEVFCRVPGRFSVYNALAAWAWAEECGVSPQARREALANLAVPGRFESVTDGDFQVIVDYAHTPDGLENVLTAAREITAGRLIAVFGCGGDRDRTKRPLMGAAVAKYADFAFVTSDNPRTEDPEKIIADILPGLRDFTCEKITDRRQAIVSAVRLARAGDTVVIAGKGHEDYQIIGREKFPFDDREEARQALREQKQ